MIVHKKQGPIHILQTQRGEGGNLI